MNFRVLLVDFFIFFAFGSNKSIACQKLSSIIYYRWSFIHDADRIVIREASFDSAKFEKLSLDEHDTQS